MEAMILAAGTGTRLKPLTDRIPKALIEVKGRPMLARVLDRLIEAGATRIIVNVHHHENQIRSFLREYPPSEIDIVMSSEPDGPYDTGGGLFAAAPLIKEKSPLLLHNVDVISSVPLDQMRAAHDADQDRSDSTPVATLAVMSRDADRRLLFDDHGLMGWENTGSDRAAIGSRRVRDQVGAVESFAFTGIHVVDPKIFTLTERTGTFSIITLYLELAAAGYTILPFDVSSFEWIDIGTREQLEEAERRDLNS
jgi:NDP-sugar pyrophosphorylase family protein